MLLIGYRNKMAVSLLKRGCLYTTRRFTLSASSWRLYSSNKEGAGSTSSVDSEEKTNKQCDNISEAQISPLDSSESIANPPNIQQHPSGSSPTERAVDKFFKVVEKVKQYEGRTETSNISEAAAIETQGIGQEDSRSESEIQPFATMLRKSKFISLGEFSGRLAEGTIFEVLGDDLYIDFGGKFHCVCPRPKKNPGHYHRGKKVLVTLQAMEMSSAFLGSDKHITLLEGDATLIGMAPSHGHQRASTFKQ